MTAQRRAEALQEYREAALRQRLDALGAANRIRVYRAEVCRDVAAARTEPWLVLVNKDDRLQGMPVEKLLGAVPGVGPDHLKRLCKEARVSPHRTVGHLTLAERAGLIRVLREFVGRSKHWHNKVSAT